MLRNGDYVKLLDFGLAKVTDSSKPLATETTPGTIMGTPQYMSPEQASGDAVDVRTDIWSLGVVLYEMITGHAPFAGSNVTEMMRAILTHSPSPLSRYIKETSRPESLVERAIAKSVDDRYPTAADLLASLKRVRRSLETGSDSGASERHPPAVGFSTVKIQTEEPLRSTRRRHRRKVIRSLAILPFVNATLA